MGFEFFSRMPGALFSSRQTVAQQADDSRNSSDATSSSTRMKLDEHLNKEGPADKSQDPQQQQQGQRQQQQAPSTPERGGRGCAGEAGQQGQEEDDGKHAHAMATEKGYVMVEPPCTPSAPMEQDVAEPQAQGTTVIAPAPQELEQQQHAGGKEDDERVRDVVMQQQQQQQQESNQPLPHDEAQIQQQASSAVPLLPLPVIIPAEPDNTISTSSSSSSTPTKSSSSNKKSSSTTGRSSPQTQQLQRKRIPVEPAWEDKVAFVMVQSYQDTETPLAVIKNLSGAHSIELLPPPSSESSSSSSSISGLEIEIVAKTWQELKEAEALLRLVFQYYKGEGKWWLYTIPTFVSCIIAGIKGTELPQFSNPTLGLHCAIAPYDEASTRRAFFLTCPEWGPQDAAYHFIKKCWEYWKELGLERQLDRYLSVILGVVIVAIRADGNCLFRALARSVVGEEEAHMVVRKAVVGFMRSSDELKSFIVAEDEGEDSAAFAERYFGEMEKDGTWGDQVEITAFTRVYRRSVRVWSYNYAEARLLSVVTPLDDSTPSSSSSSSSSSSTTTTTPPSTPTAAAAPAVPEEEIWLLHLHGHYSLLQAGEPPKDLAWEKMLREWGEKKEERTNVLSARQQQQQLLQQKLQRQQQQQQQQQQVAREEKEGGREGGREEGKAVPRIIPALPECDDDDEEEGDGGKEGLPTLMEEDPSSSRSGRRREEEDGGLSQPMLPVE